MGADNYVAKINNEAKYVKKVNSEIMNSLNAIVKFTGVFMIPVGIGLFLASVDELRRGAAPGADTLSWLGAEILAGRVPASAILSTVGALLGMIPQGLVLLTSSVLAIATVRLARRNVLAQQLYCIETLARVDVLCLDKTGTITSGRMAVEGVYPLAVSGTPRDAAPRGAESGSVTMADLALANIARVTSEDANETCRALLDRYEGAGVPELACERVVPFSSARKYSGGVFAGGSYVMGAAQFVLSPKAFARLEDRVAELADTCRVLVVAAVDGFDDDDGIVGEARPVGLVTIRDEIRPSAAQTIAYFNEQGVELNVISGDDPRTVSSIARVVGIPGAGAFVDATTLDTPAKIDAAVERYHVFGRVTPQQKRELVVALKRRGHTVAMTGDGVNDVLALKEADCSVAMAAGSDAARNVAEIVLVDNDFASMPAVVAEGRRSINNLQRSAALFLTKTLFSMGLAAICIAVPPYPFEPIQMSLINFFCIGYPGFVLGLEPNRQHVRGRFLVNVIRKALPASAAVILAACLDMAICALLGYDELVLSTMCLVTTCVTGVTLIWRISQPFTPLRAGLLATIVAGIVGGILLLPDFFSIAHLTLGMAAGLAVVSIAASAAFLFLADRMDRLEFAGRRSATGFGRGVKVSVRRGSRHVSSTGSAARRQIARIVEAARRKKQETELTRAQAEAERGVTAGRGGEGVAPSGASSKGKRRVTQTAAGIHVRMPRQRSSRPRGKGGSDS